jgi:putative oxidoreductase
MTAILTAGLGLKPQHYDAALACRAEGLCFEVHPENYPAAGSPGCNVLKRYVSSIRFHCTAYRFHLPAPNGTAKAHSAASAASMIKPSKGVFMNYTTTTETIPAGGICKSWNRIADALTNLVGHTSLALVDRIAIAAIFFYSGRTKVDGILTLNDSAYTLFQEEYRVPLIPPDIAAHMAAYAEHLFPILLVLGLFTRLSALALLGMTAVIQIFVYPDAWPTHLSWAGLLLYLIAHGGGKISADHAIGVK